MVKKFDAAFDYVMSFEDAKRSGIVENNPDDRGGITKYGISIAFLLSLPKESLNKYGFFDEPISETTIDNITLDQAKNILNHEFWQPSNLVAITSQSIINFIFDMAVNHGLGTAIKAAQRSCWAILADRDCLVEDGILGTETASKINQCTFYLLPTLRAERACIYRSIVVKYPSQRKFLEGWLNRTYANSHKKE